MVAYLPPQPVNLYDHYSKEEGFPSTSTNWLQWHFSLQWVALSLTWPTRHLELITQSSEAKNKSKFPFHGIWYFPYNHICTWAAIDLSIWPHIQFCHCFDYAISDDTFCTIEINLLTFSLSFLFLVKKNNNSIFFVSLPSKKSNNFSGYFSILTICCIFF